MLRIATISYVTSNSTIRVLFSLPAPVVVTNIQVVSYLVLPVSKYYQYVVIV